MQKHITFVVLLFITVALGGCVTSYQYRAHGDVMMTDGETRQAVLYWHKDEGRRWYGKKYEQPDTSLTMRICEGMPKIFALNEDGHVELRSKSGDFRVARINAEGELEEQDAERLGDGDNCGVIQVDGTAVGTDGLPQGTRPTVTILCRNDTRPDRYPAMSQYRFGAVARQVSEDDRSGPDPCIEAD